MGSSELINPLCAIWHVREQRGTSIWFCLLLFWELSQVKGLCFWGSFQWLASMSLWASLCSSFPVVSIAGCSGDWVWRHATCDLAIAAVGLLLPNCGSLRDLHSRWCWAERSLARAANTWLRTLLIFSKWRMRSSWVNIQPFFGWGTKLAHPFLLGFSFFSFTWSFHPFSFSKRTSPC